MAVAKENKGLIERFHHQPNLCGLLHGSAGKVPLHHICQCGYFGHRMHGNYRKKIKWHCLVCSRDWLVKA